MLLFCKSVHVINILLFATVLCSCRNLQSSQDPYIRADRIIENTKEYCIKRFLYLDTEWFRVFIADNDSKGKVGNPAWDYILHLDDVKTGVTYRWDCCIAVKPYIRKG